MVAALPVYVVPEAPPEPELLTVSAKGEAAVILQVDPKVQLMPFTVVALLASAELGMAPAATDKLGVDVEFVTVGTNHVGHDPEGAVKDVTVPVPLGVPHVPSPRQ